MNQREARPEDYARYYAKYALACLELGLRWMNDRMAEHRERLRKHEQDDKAGRYFG